MADSDPWFSMVDSELSETPFGSAYLGEVQALTTQGCPIPPAAAPPVGDAFGGAPTSTQKGTVHHPRKPVKPSHAKKRRRRRPRKAAARRNVHRRSSKRR